MVFVGQTRSAKLVRRLWERGIGECTVRGELPPRRHPWFYDNGAFSDWRAGRPFDEAQFSADIEAVRRSGDTPRWIVLPDIVAGGRDSLIESARWIPSLNGLAPLYLAVQDGMSAEDVRPFAGRVAGLFVGGTLEWKVRTGAEWVCLAHSLGLRCHIGRCGSENRIAWARRIGADSIDSSLPLWSEENLDRFLRALEPAQTEFARFAEAA
jgi:hypothetical protein